MERSETMPRLVGDSALDARDDDFTPLSGVGRRLVVAVVIGAGLSVACWVLLPRFGVHVSPLIPLGVVALFFVPYILSLIETGRGKKDVEEEDEGRPIGCCGPRPVGRILTSKPVDHGGCCGGGGETKATGGGCGCRH